MDDFDLVVRLGVMLLVVLLLLLPFLLRDGVVGLLLVLLLLLLLLLLTLPLEEVETDCRRVVTIFGLCMCVCYDGLED
jgi:hypothetical protein